MCLPAFAFCLWLIEPTYGYLVPIIILQHSNTIPGGHVSPPLQPIPLPTRENFVYASYQYGIGLIIVVLRRANLR
jgi:hypothetical protein